MTQVQSPEFPGVFCFPWQEGSSSSTVVTTKVPDVPEATLKIYQDAHFYCGCPAFVLRKMCPLSPIPKKVTQRLWEPGRDLLWIQGCQNMRDGYKKIEILATFPLIFARQTRDSGDVFDFSQWTAEKGWSQSHLSFTSHECQLAVEVSSYRFYKVDCEWKVFSFKCKRIGQCKAGMSQSCNCWEPVAMNVCSLQAGQYLLVKDIMCHGYPHLGLNFDYPRCLNF